MKCAHYRAPSDAVFQQVKVLKLRQIFLQNVLMFMFRFMKESLPAIFDDFFCVNRDQIARVTRQSDNFYIIQHRTNLFKKSIRIFGPQIWNKTAIHLNTNCTYHSFKKRVQILITSQKCPIQ